MKAATKNLCARCQCVIEQDDSAVATMDLQSFSFLLVENWRELPTVAAVYFILGESPDVVYYVGQTQNLRTRWNLQPHRERAQQTVPGARVAWVEFPANRLKDIEESAIRRFGPLWNRHGDDYRSPSEIVREFPISKDWSHKRRVA